METDWVERAFEKAEEEYFEYVDSWEWFPKDYNPFLTEEGIDEEKEYDKIQEKIDMVEELLEPLQKQKKVIWNRAIERARKKFEEMQEKGDI